jgi:hypothetical protein
LMNSSEDAILFMFSRSSNAKNSGRGRPVTIPIDPAYNYRCGLLVLLVRLELDPGQHGRVWQSPCGCGSITGRQSSRRERPGSSTPILIVRVLK